MVELYDTETLLLFYDQEATFGINLFLFFYCKNQLCIFFHALYHHDFHTLVKSGVSGVVVLLRLFGGNNSTYRG